MSTDEIRYTSVYLQTQFYSQCLRCASIVMNQAEHTIWHNNTDLAFMTIFQILASNSEDIDLEQLLPKGSPQSRVHTKEENIEFRKKWDEQYEAAQRRDREKNNARGL